MGARIHRSIRSERVVCPSLVSIVAVLMMGIPRAHGNEIPLFEQEPFDRITIRSEEETTSIDILPISDRDVQRLAQKQPKDKLRIRLIAYPERLFEVGTEYVTEVRPFKQLVMDEAKRLVDQRKLDAAFSYLRYLSQTAPDLPGLESLVSTLLLYDAAKTFGDQQWRETLAILQELKRREPTNRRLAPAVRSVVRKMLQADLDAQRYRNARASLDWITKRHSDVPGIAEEARDWNEKFRFVAQQLLQRSESQLRARNWQQAMRECDLATQADPGNEQAAELLHRILRSYPTIAVAVPQVTPDAGEQVPLEWNSMRVRRLLQRQLVDQIGFGSDGGTYDSSWARIVAEDVANHVSVTLLPRAPTGRGPISAFDVARFLTGPDRPVSGNAHGMQWLRRVRVVDPATLILELRYPVLQPRRLLTFPIAKLDPKDAATRPFLRSGEPSQDGSCSFIVNDEYLLTEDEGLREIREVPIRRSAERVEALLRGDVQAVTRLAPADVQRVASDSRFAVVAYSAPSLHFLVPNASSDPGSNRTFRRALVYAMDRGRILREEVLGGSDIEGCRVLSGPFPMGFGFDDPLAYAVDPEVAPLEYDPLLASVLSRLATSEIQGKPPDGEHKSKPERPIQLRFPASANAQAACEAIASSWKTVGIATDAKALENGRVWPTDEPWDFVYVEAVITEPLHDALNLFQRRGLVSDASPYLKLALRRLRRAKDWRSARTALQQVHRLASEEVCLLPLWQIREHLAVHKRVSGMASAPLTFYQGVEHWRVSADMDSLAHR